MQVVQLHQALLLGVGMSQSIFKTHRRGLMGSKQLGAEYMPEVKERARRMKAAIREEQQPANERQLLLPFPAPSCKL